mmetsp:Transcript_97785/g.209783  ORF Transcript_97785/g.209783 Transcript_97785/m.209783 type:complete len:202 (+) Transcript_97785:23-628(+)
MRGGGSTNNYGETPGALGGAPSGAPDGAHGMAVAASMAWGPTSIATDELPDQARQSNVVVVTTCEHRLGCEALGHATAIAAEVIPYAPHRCETSTRTFQGLLANLAAATASRVPKGVQEGGVELPGGPGILWRATNSDAPKSLRDFGGISSGSLRRPTFQPRGALRWTAGRPPRTQRSAAAATALRQCEALEGPACRTELR